MNPKKIWASMVLTLFITTVFGRAPLSITSPDRSVRIKVDVSDKIYYSLIVDNIEIVHSSGVGMQINNEHSNWKLKRSKVSEHSAVLTPTIWQKSKTINDDYNQLHLEFQNGFALDWRAYNNGMAWQWSVSRPGEYKVTDEEASLNLGVQSKSWYPQEDGFYSHNERQYKEYGLGEIDADKMASLPVLFEAQGIKLLLTESSLFDYAGMWVRGDGKGSINAVFPKYPRSKEVTSDRDERVTAREDFIAATQGSRSFPWRILMIAREDKDLLSNQLVYQMARPATGDFSWVKPGKVSWDWWNANNIYGVDFRAGINTKTYKYYIDFASEYGIEYVILDEGWCDTRDLTKVSPDIDMAELSAYAKEKGVGLVLWTTWLVLDKQLDEALAQFEKWGVKGIKVDFMQRDDQEMVNYYEKVSKAAASRHLLVDFHGAYKPTGWQRSYPNVLTSEGVLGNEISKFGGAVTPDHTTTIPFIRMAAGPMDFTPGGMLNAQKDAWKAVSTEPMTMGTRCNQLAMYVVYESQLQMLCDMPTHYFREPECMEFLKSVPVEWAETVPLQAKVGDYIMVARKAKSGDWYVGAMTDWTPRELELDFSFLGSGKYDMDIWKDGINADRNAKDFKVEKMKVDANTVLKIHLAPGGGWVARIVPE